ncbi:hypothetical protein ACRE_005740 [Hapsidospora chrysogenum ATCC 11550]|uniref:Uncharacterized protein n=1 Tax=Hapsidospora chrysogenum (strain ATCC 11550 / CBS 779.69 / DSM 880 / IAM 14645 / JCM 23072 / IMI 49137) TaxID=857340 RepID=A0A086TGI1_HAPC1|nr:hypothetical protein ACRE_005740 [Hapsidospora chrysogenum ATCC 11550]
MFIRKRLNYDDRIQAPEAICRNGCIFQQARPSHQQEQQQQQQQQPVHSTTRVNDVNCFLHIGGPAAGPGFDLTSTF